MTTMAPAAVRQPRWRRRLFALAPYALLIPGLLWLLYFFVWPVFQMLLMSLSSGTLDSGFRLTWTTKPYVDALTKFPTQWGNSLLYAGMATLMVARFPGSGHRPSSTGPGRGGADRGECRRWRP